MLLKTESINPVKPGKFNERLAGRGKIYRTGCPEARREQSGICHTKMMLDALKSPLPPFRKGGCGLGALVGFPLKGAGEF